MKTAEDVELSEAQIAVHWREEEYFYPPAKFVGQANASDAAIFERFKEENFPECFKEYADLLTGDKYWHTTLDTSKSASNDLIACDDDNPRRDAGGFLMSGPAGGSGRAR